MIERLELVPGQRVVDLAAGPGDTGFMAAEIIAPTGELICSDASEAMLDVARARALELGVMNVDFKLLELEWIDLPTADVDAALCRWGLMFCVDPVAAMREVRRVLRPGGRLTLAVWDDPSLNPWATIPSRALISLGHAEPPNPDAPGMFSLASWEKLEEMLADAGFVEVLIDTVELPRSSDSVAAFVAETLDLSRPFSDTYEALEQSDREAVLREIEDLLEPFVSHDGTLRLPARSIVALAHA